MKHANKGEWSELYAFIRLLKDGKIYAADENVNRLDNVYFPILKLIREEQANQATDYITGTKIKIFQNGALLDEIDNSSLEQPVDVLYKRIFEGADTAGAFSIEEAEQLMENLHITKIKAPSLDKKDLTMQIHDIQTGYQPVVGFSVKSDIGNPPTLLNAGKNTRFVYEIHGITDQTMQEINSIDKSVSAEYMRTRMELLFSKALSVSYHSMKNEIFEDNLIMIDSRLPELYGNMILNHFRYIGEKLYDCGLLCNTLEITNPLGYRKTDVYRYKIKKLLCAAALGMTPGTEWNGLDNASGGYIIIRKDGNVLCYHIYNRNFFEEYLLRNTQFDRPSASRHDYGYIYKHDNKFFIDLNVQVRFKSITAATKEKTFDEKLLQRLVAYAEKSKQT